MLQCLRPLSPPMSRYSPPPPLWVGGGGGPTVCFCKPHPGFVFPPPSPVGCGCGDGTVPTLFDGRAKPCITPCEPCPAPECWVCLHRGAADTHQTVSNKPPDWFCFDFLREYKESGGLAQPCLDRHSIGRGEQGCCVYPRQHRARSTFLDFLKEIKGKPAWGLA